ncbi:MAG TPA: hypothetical protein VJ020_03910 [Anaerolineales bacterium]|nr:hypothetical protein [Anaerolineales bacterium]
MANASTRSGSLHLLDFSSTSTNRGSAQASDLAGAFDPAPAPLQGQQPGEAPTTLLIQ